MELRHSFRWWLDIAAIVAIVVLGYFVCDWRLLGAW